MASSTQADLLIRAGSVETFDAAAGVVRSLAVRDGRVLAVGREPGDLDDLAGATTTVLDDPGLHVLPAFHDTHVHQYEGGLNLLTVQVAGVACVDELVAAMGDAAARQPPGTWLVSAKNWHESTLREGRLPTADELDRVSTEHPVCVRRGSHAVVVNRRALQLAHITADTADPPGGRIGRAPDGRPDGRLLGDPAVELVARLLPPVTFAERVEGLARCCRLFNAHGIASARDPGIATADFAVYQHLWAAGALTVRSEVMLRLDEGWSPRRMRAELDRWGLRTGFGDDLLTIGGVKMFVDGRIEDAALREPYENDPGWFGTLHIDEPTLTAMVADAVERGWDVGCHAVGDAAMDVVLGAYARVLGDRPNLSPHRLVVEHALLSTEEQRRRAAALGIGVSLHPPLLHAFGSDIRRCWGEKRANAALAVRDWVESGARVAAGSDGNVPPFDPLLAIWTMLTRGTASAGRLGCDQAVDRRTAFRLYTVDAARLVPRGNRSGTLVPGRPADLVAYTEDPLGCPVDLLPDVAPALT
ncbi:MAG TPA: amidohydrolase, partial [Streptosporangiales bacterium]